MAAMSHASTSAGPVMLDLGRASRTTKGPPGPFVEFALNWALPRLRLDD